MAISLTDIRQRIVAAIVAELGASGWREANAPYDRFAETDSDKRMDYGFAVGTPDTRYLQGRQRRGEGALVVTDLGVRYSLRSKAKAQVESYDDALSAEAALIKAVMTKAKSADLHIKFISANRTQDANHVLGSLMFEAQHTLALQ